MKLYIIQAKKNMQHEAGRRLLQQVMQEMELQDFTILKSERGKPYVENAGFFFNISHSGEYVVLVTGTCELGVDIQEKKNVNAEALAKRFFTEQEYEVIAANTAKIELFCKLWTRKEAYGKWLGTGLTEKVLKTDMLQKPKDVFFVEYTELENYQICICYGKEEEVEEIISIFEG